jgi:DNA invertase Pin-like site-specific DNA recombinase
MATGRFVAYLRVSTQRQGTSGLGLEAQRKAITDYLNGGNWQLVAEHVEVESGKRDDRPELAKALAACRVHGATLLIAKLDRLARNVAFISNLMQAGVEFVAVDFPRANRLTVHILAAVAEHEMISARTKTALAASQARGVPPGNPANLQDRAKGTARSAVVRWERSERRAANLRPMVAAVRASGATSLRALAAELTRRAVPAPGGGSWHANAVRRLLAGWHLPGSSRQVAAWPWSPTESASRGPHGG